MIGLLQRLKRSDQTGNLVKSIAKLADKEREVRTLEMAIEYISSLEEEDLARVWPRLMAAIYSQTPSTSRDRIAGQPGQKSAPSNDAPPGLNNFFFT